MGYSDGLRASILLFGGQVAATMTHAHADEFLVEGIRAGDASAWRDLIERYSGRLLAFARARAPGRSDADDLVQETFIGFLNSITHYDPQRSLETYLFTILRYKLYDLLRQRKTHVTTEAADAADWWERVLPADTETPSGVAIHAEMRKAQEQLLADLLRRLIHELRDRNAFTDLQVIELVFYAGMRNLDVGELLDMDQKAVAGVKFRAIQKIQKYLEEQASDDSAQLADASADMTVANVWRTHRLTCLKRNTLGAYLLSVLEEPWRGYTQFHVDVVGCPLCLANIADLQEEQAGEVTRDTTRYFQSSVGFLSRAT